MKTTLEIPDALFRKAKAVAASQGRSMKDYVAEALAEKLADANDRGGWRDVVGKLSPAATRAAKEVDRYLKSAPFSQVDLEIWG